MVAQVGFTQDNHIFFQVGEFYLECNKFQQLIALHGGEYCCEDGTVVLETSYGEEIYWLDLYTKELFLEVSIGDSLNEVSEFQVTRGKTVFFHP